MMNTPLPTRKRTRLEQYDYSTPGAYFITICTHERKNVLSKIVGGDGLAAARSRSGSDNTPVLSFKTLTPLRYPDDPLMPLTPQIQLTRIGKITEKYLLSSENIPGVKIDRYIIMPDHIHAIIFLYPNEYASRKGGSSRAPTPTNEMLPHVISTFKRFRNKEWGTNLWQSRSYDHIIRDREDYEEHLRYIRDNPERWHYDELYRAE